MLARSLPLRRLRARGALYLVASVAWITLAVAGPAAAQHIDGPMGGPAKPANPEQQKMQALMAAQMQLLQLQRQALADPAIAKEQTELRSFMEAEMVKRDPAMKGKLARFYGLEKDIEAARAANPPDPARMQTLMSEGRELAQALTEGQAAVMKIPEVKKRMDAFEAKLDKKMVELNPEVPKMKKLLDDARAEMAGSAPPGALPPGH